MKIVTKTSDPALFRRMEKRLTDGGELVLGGLCEWTSGPGLNGVLACVYWLVWSKDRTVFGLNVEEYESITEDRAQHLAEEEGNDDDDPYTWSISNLDSTSEIGAIAILEKHERMKDDDIAEHLQEAYCDAGGTSITHVKCP